MLTDRPQQLEELKTLNRIAERLNQAVDVRGVLDESLADLVRLMDLEIGWIGLKEHPQREAQASDRFVPEAHHSLPPAMDPDSAALWEGSCTCQALGSAGKLCEAYYEVRCSRLGQASGDSRGCLCTPPYPSGLKTGCRES